MNYPPHVTPIDDLPELDELTGQPGMGMGFAQGMHTPGRSFSGFRGQPPPQEVPDVSNAIRGQHVPPMESGMMGQRMLAGNMGAGGYNKYGSAYAPQVGPGPHRMAPARQINLGPGMAERQMPPPSIMQQRDFPVIDQDINPYPFANSPNNFEVVLEGYEDPNKNVGFAGSCLDVSNHVENCPICRRIYKNDKTVLIIAIVILSILCILLLKKVLNL